MKYLKRLLLLIFVVYLLPTFAAAGLWAMKDRPGRWSEANWGSAHILPEARNSEEAAIYIFSAATGAALG